ncbi:MAG: MFS transporter [Hyphomicrobiaceae bacterium]
MKPGQIPILEFVIANIRWLFAGLFLSFLSSFGQTFFIAMFGGEIRAAFGLSNGAFGTLYMIGTLASAATLIWMGQLADVMRVRVLGSLTIIGLAIACMSMASAAGYISLLLAIYLLRLTGQGMMSHVAVTAMARWFDAYRGRAIAFSVFGYPIGEAVFPTIAVLLTAWVGWRTSWLIVAGALLVIGLPVFLLALRQRRIPGRSGEEPPAVDFPGMVHWTRIEVLSNPLVWLIFPCILAPAFIVTATFFHQSYLAETKGWSLAFWAACYPLYAVTSVASTIVSGWGVDRWSGRQLLPFVCVPLGLGFLVLAIGNDPWVAVIGMALIGFSAGSTNTIFGSVWPELYGTRHLGSSKALATAAMVFSSALGPGVMGVLIDAGVSLERQFLAMAVYCFAVSGLAIALQGRMRLTQPELYGFKP